MYLNQGFCSMKNDKIPRCERTKVFAQMSFVIQIHFFQIRIAKNFKIALVLLDDIWCHYFLHQTPPIYFPIKLFISIQHILLTTWQHLKKTQQIEKIYIQRQQLLKVYVTFHRYSHIYSSPSKLRFYLVVVLQGKWCTPKLVFKLKTLNIIFWMGYPYNVLPHNRTNLDTKC
jgi:hypothetical protein